MSAPLLEVRDLVAGYGSNTVLHGVNYTVQPGESVAMVGLNGAGKSVSLRCVAGLLKPWTGRVILEGADITRHSPERRARDGMGMVPQGRGIFAGLTVEQNLRLGGYRLRGKEFAARVAEAYSRFPRLGERRRQRAGTMSGGEQAMLSLARALVAGPRLLLLDEPSAGLSPVATGEMTGYIAELNREGVTILLVEQNIGMALRLATRVLLMQKGQIVRDAHPGSLQDRAALLTELGAGALYDAEQGNPRAEPASVTP
ncbi:MAG: ABC transporter ATP-binding protein [Candidatus Dormibacteria bacterium]